MVLVSVNMDVSPVPAKSGSSDFSIERILSDERRNEDDTPSWLCCTRYQPPRIPRPSSSSTSRARRSGRHARVPFTGAQAAALEAAYARAPYLAPPALRALAAALQLRDDRIKIWFQNRRARERREKCSAIAPPHSVPLPPTVPQTLVTNPPWIAHNKTERPALSNPGLNYNLMTEPHISNSEITFTVPYSFNNSFSESDDDRSLEDRPDTPLDVETVEE